MYALTDRDIKFAIGALADIMEHLVVDMARNHEPWMEQLKTIKRLRIIADYKLNKPIGILGQYKWDSIDTEV